MKTATLETGTETSCFHTAPSGFWAADWDSRRRQKSAAWALLWAMAASRIRWSSRAPASTRSMAASAAPGSPEAISISTNQGCGSENGARTPVMLRTAKSTPMRGDQLEALHRAAALGLGARQQGDGGGRIVHRREGHGPRDEGGNSFRLAAVTTPSVPSAPINSCFKS